MTAPAFGSIGTYLETSSATPAWAVPASVASGDIIVIPIFVDTAATITGLPSGFAEAASSPIARPSGGGAHSLHVVWKRATGADTGTYGFTLSGSAFVAGAALRYTGCAASGNPWDVTTSADGGATNSTTTPAVSVTTTGADRMLLFAGTNWGGGAWTPPTGFTERMDNSSEVNTADDKPQAVAGSSGSVTATCAGSNKTLAWLGALLPVASGTVYAKTGGGAVPAAGSGAKTVTSAAVITKAGGAVASAAGSGTRVLNHQKAGGAVSAAAGSGAKTVTSAAVITKTGGGAAPAVGSGAKTVTSASTYAKAGGAAANAAGSGARTVEHNKVGGAVSAGAGAGTKTVTGSSDIAKAGGGAAVAAGGGAKAITSATVHVKTGGGAATSAGSGARITSGAAVIVKSGGGTATGAGIALKVVIHPTIYVKTGGGVAHCVGGSVPAAPEIPGPVAGWPPVFTGPERAPLVLFSGPEAAPLVLISAPAPAPLVLFSGPEPAPSPGSTPHPMMARRGLARRSLPGPADEFVIEEFRALRARRRAAKIRRANQ